MDRDRLKAAWVGGAIDGIGKAEVEDNVGNVVWEVDIGIPEAAEMKEAGLAKADIRGEVQQNETCGACVDETKGTADKQLADRRTPSWKDEPNRMDGDIRSQSSDQTQHGTIPMIMMIRTLITIISTKQS